MLTVASTTVVALTALIAFGVFFRRQENMRPAWAGLMAGAIAYSGAVVLRTSGHALPSDYLVCLGTALVAIGATLTWWVDRRPSWSIDETLDFLFALFATALCGWELLLQPLQSGGASRSSWALALSLICAIGAVRILASLTRTKASLPLLSVAGLGLCIMAFGFSQQPNVRNAADTFWSSAEIWLLVALASSAALTFVWTNLSLESPTEWAYGHYFRNTMLLIAASLPAIATAFSIHTSRGAHGSGIFAWLLLLGGLVIARCVRAYLVISHLESSVSSRNALLHIPTQAVSVTNDHDFACLLQDLTNLAATMIGASRAEMTLWTGDGPGVVRRLVTSGLTETERTLLGVHPGHPHINQDGTADALCARVVRRDDLDLSVAARNAWNVAGKCDVLVIPLHAGERHIGLIELWSPGTSHPFRQAQVEIGSDLGGDAGQMIEHGHLIMASRGEVVQAEMLLAVSEVFSRGNSLDDCLASVAERLIRRAESDRITSLRIAREAKLDHLTRGLCYAALEGPRLLNLLCFGD